MNTYLVEKRDSQLVLKQSKSILHITNKILLDKSKDEWLIEIWKWADENNISNKIIPRDKNELIQLEKINLYGQGLNNIPEEITHLKNITYIDLAYNGLSELPSDMGALKKLNFLSIATNNLRELPASITSLMELKNFWFNSNNDLKLNDKQLSWIEDLKGNGCYIY